MTVKRDVMSIVKRSLSWPRKLKSRTISSACGLSLMYDAKVLTIGAINVSNSRFNFLVFLSLIVTTRLIPRVCDDFLMQN